MVASSLVSRESLIALVILGFLSGWVGAQQNCTEITSCSACIGQAECIWCFDTSYPSSSPRCDWVDNNFNNSCPASSVEDPPNQNTPMTLQLNSENQVSLESLDLKLKVGKPESFTVSVKAAENFPLDLYLLMDLSGSFRDDLVTVQDVAPPLFGNLSNVTQQFRVGFGGFVDKPVPPYSSLGQLRELLSDGACVASAGEADCIAPFSFEHFANFTKEANSFTNDINDLMISATADDPEGTLEAMLQAVVCTDVIGWDDESRKILLVITDDLLHTAGDGSFATINRPHDGRCYTELNVTTGKTLYTAALEFDYPSVEQVRLALLDFGIFPVIAVAPLLDNNRFVVIDEIATEIGGFTVQLADSSANLVEAIREAYDRIVNQAFLSYTAPEFLKIEVVPSCPENSTQMGLTCVGIGDGVAEFAVTVTLIECAEEVINGRNFTLEVNVPGFDQFEIRISGLCMCDCAEESQIDVNSSLCSGQGNHVCGVCECHPPFLGEVCDCDPTQMCPVFRDMVCSGSSRGTCNECGECDCVSRFSGLACECSDLNCDCSGNEISCSVCINGTQTCNCKEGFFGDNCQCTERVCIDPAGPEGVICSGNAECNPCPPAEGCMCNPQTHVGLYCGTEVAANPGCMGTETCVICAGDAAQQGVNLTDIAGCEALGESCADYWPLPEGVDNPDEYDVPGTIGSSIECSLSNIQCQYSYFQAISEMDGEPVYQVVPPSCLAIQWWAIPIIIILGLFLLGVVILVVAQIILRWLDYRELKHFEKEVQEADFTKNVNPVYQAPTMRYDNPLHGKPI